MRVERRGGARQIASIVLVALAAAAAATHAAASLAVAPAATHAAASLAAAPAATHAGGALVAAPAATPAATTLPFPITAQSRSYRVESFDAEVRVDAEGTVVVTERLRFRFDGSFQGIYRDIPIRYDTPWGLDYRLRFDLLTAIDAEGDSLRYETDRQGDDVRVKVWVPGAQNASRTIVLRYRVERALRFFDREEGFDAHDQLYWNVTGTRWTVPIDTASARVVLPEAVNEQPRAQAYTGAYGSRAEDARIERASTNEIVFRTTRRLEPGEGLTVVVGWPPGAVRRPTAVDRATDLLADNWPLGLPLVVLAGMIALFRRWGRDPALDRSVMVRYEPPEDFRPAEVGTLIDEKVDLRDIVSTVIDLAVRGYLRIEEEVNDGWFFDSTETTFVKVEDGPPQDDLRPFEREVYSGLFASGSRSTIDDLKTKFYTRIDDIERDLYDGLTERGYFRPRHDHVRTKWIVGAVVVGIALGVAGIASQKVAFFVAAVLCFGIIAAFAPFMPARTVRGRRRYLEIQGFEEFLGRTEAERFASLNLDAAAFERFLPYAMALGVADHWAGLFKGLLQQPPQWYVGPRSHFDPGGFTQRIGRMGSSLGTAMTSQPRSTSSSSGFSSGGGFSGGGFGGGGGGAF